MYYLRITLIFCLLFLVFEAHAQVPKLTLELSLKPEIYAAQAQRNPYIRESNKLNSLHVENGVVSFRARYFLKDPHWQVTSGIVYNNFNYTINNGLHPLEALGILSTIFIPGANRRFTADTFLVQQAKVNAQYISVPASISYKITKNQYRKLQFHAFAGLNIYAKTNADATFSFSKNDSARSRITPALEKDVNRYFTGNISRVLASAEAGVGFTLKIYKNIGYIGELTLPELHFISPDKNIMNRPTGFAVSVGLMYTFY